MKLIRLIWFLADVLKNSINVHDGDKYEIIKIDSYDPETNTITFKTKSFSNYAIASKISSSTTEETTENSETTDAKDNANSGNKGATTNTDVDATESGTATRDAKTDDTVTDTTTTNSSPKTGDNVILWIGLMLVSVLEVFGTYKFLRKRD